MTKSIPIRNIAIIAHVDHGKTTLVDALLRQTHVQRNIEDLGERIMDSMDLERERGITITAKNASIVYKGIKINIVDTPGHADFGGEVERTLRMVDGVLLIVDAKEGPMPQTRFVLRKALELGLKPIVVINKIDRPDAIISDVENHTFDLFCELNASEEQLDFPIVYASALEGIAKKNIHDTSSDITPLLDTIIHTFPPPAVKQHAPLQILVLALKADFYKGNMGIGKITAGSIEKGMLACLVDREGNMTRTRVKSVMVYEGLKQVERDKVSAGEIVAVAGFDEIGIGETITDPDQPCPLPPPEIDEPTVQMRIGVNTSPFAGREGKYVTSRALMERLYKEVETNVSLRVAPTESANTFMVSGRGELHIAVLIETMRREGFELELAQLEVIFHEENGVKLEPYEFLTIDVPQEYYGSVVEEIGQRKAALLNMYQTPKGEVHLEYQISTRAVIGLKGALMTKTRGTAILYHAFDEYKPLMKDSFRPVSRGSLVSSENGVSTAYALNNAQMRGALFIGPNVDVYCGMIIGENSRNEDLDLSPCKTKKLTNMRASGSDAAVKLTPPREMTLDLAIEYIGPNELVEVTPESIRLRMKELDATARIRARRRTEVA
ncbi:MAG: translational GTPase TypA [Candidatus Auribacterota bacterium]